MAANPAPAVGGDPGPPPLAHILIPYGNLVGQAPLPVGAQAPVPNTGQIIGIQTVQHGAPAATISHTDRLRRLQELFFLRNPQLDPQSRAGKTFRNGYFAANGSIVSGSMRNNEAWIAQMVGYPPPTGPCTECEEGRGRFTRCMVDIPRTFLASNPGVLTDKVGVDYACASCLYGDGSGECSIRLACKNLYQSLCLHLILTV